MEALPKDVAKALKSQFPHIDLSTLVRIGSGWNATAWRARVETQQWVIRIPKLESAASEIGRQTKLGLHLSALEFPVPHGWRLLRGSSGRIVGGAYIFIDRTSAPTHGRGLDAIAGEIANFLTRLHGLPTRVPIEECGAQDLDPWEDRYRGLIETYGRMTGPRTQSWLNRVAPQLEQASRLATSHVLVHGDLAPEHVICDDVGGVLGVLDFSGPLVTDAALDFGRLAQRWGQRFASLVLERYEQPVDGRFSERMLLYARLEPLRTMEVATQRDLPNWISWARRRLAATAAIDTRSRDPK